jgi:hypothetical protein
MKATVYDYDGTKRVTLPEPFYESSASGPEDYTGVWITALYYGPRSGRAFKRTYSIWEIGGRVTGERYEEISLADLLRVADHVGAELPDYIPAPIVE